MKNNLSRFNRKAALVIAVLFSALVLGATQASAYNGNGNQNQNGYYGPHGHYYPYTYHNHQRGYWHQNNSGVRFFIVVG
jgi:hypothetical protein